MSVWTAREENIPEQTSNCAFHQLPLMFWPRLRAATLLGSWEMVLTPPPVSIGHSVVSPNIGYTTHIWLIHKSRLSHTVVRSVTRRHCFKAVRTTCIYSIPPLWKMSLLGKVPGLLIVSDSEGLIGPAAWPLVILAIRSKTIKQQSTVGNLSNIRIRQRQKGSGWEGVALKAVRQLNEWAFPAHGIHILGQLLRLSVDRWLRSPQQADGGMVDGHCSTRGQEVMGALMISLGDLQSNLMRSAR